MNPERAAMLLAFHDEGEILTRAQIFERSGVHDRLHLETLIFGGFVKPTEWKPNYPREYRLTEAGNEKRHFYNVGEALRYG